MKDKSVSSTNPLHTCFYVSNRYFLLAGRLFLFVFFPVVVRLREAEANIYHSDTQTKIQMLL